MSPSIILTLDILLSIGTIIFNTHTHHTPCWGSRGWVVPDRPPTAAWMATVGWETHQTGMDDYSIKTPRQSAQTNLQLETLPQIYETGPRMVRTCCIRGKFPLALADTAHAHLLFNVRIIYCVGTSTVRSFPHTTLFKQDVLLCITTFSPSFRSRGRSPGRPFYLQSRWNQSHRNSKCWVYFLGDSVSGLWVAMPVPKPSTKWGNKRHFLDRSYDIGVTTQRNTMFTYNMYTYRFFLCIHRFSQNQVTHRSILYPRV